MRIEDMILVSVDDHVIEPRTLFDRHIPAKWKDRAPKMVKNQNSQNGADMPHPKRSCQKTTYRRCRKSRLNFLP